MKINYNCSKIQKIASHHTAACIRASVALISLTSSFYTLAAISINIGDNLTTVTVDFKGTQDLILKELKDKDLEHLAAARSSGIAIIAYDRDFDGIKEYFTPKEFLESMKMKTHETLY